MSEENITRSGSGALLFSTIGTVFLQHRDDVPGILSPGKYALFGGHIEDGESMEDALARELEEEIRLDISTKRVEFYKTFDYTQVDTGEIMKCNVFLVYDVKREELELHEGQAIVEIDLNSDLNKLPLAEYLKIILYEYKKTYQAKK